MKLEFWKMHGLGNDYVVIDDREEILDEHHLPEIARSLCERHFGVGADGLLIVADSMSEEIRMRIFNADGSEAEMCGNGIRCLARYCFEKNIINKTEFRIETKSGMRRVNIVSQDADIRAIRVDMGRPEIQSLEEKIEIDGVEYTVAIVSMGNPHAVMKTKSLSDALVTGIGPKVENHKRFPQKTNVEFVYVKNPGEIEIRVWERGVGETLACGTGACAAVVAGHKLRELDDTVTVHLLGGDLEIEVAERVYLTGPAVKVFEGTIDL